MVELVLGVDDAGRGPVIGPMILCGCIVDKKHDKELRNIGVKDSKLVTPSRREFLEKKIKELAQSYELIVCSPEEIDITNSEGLKLNEFEAEHFAQIINKLNKGDERLKVVVDCPSPTIKKWEDYLKKRVNNLSNLEVSAEHKADKNHIAVSCASILAKCERERQMDKIKEKFGSEVGSGYPSDPLTIRFLEKNAKKYQNEGIFRRSWITYKKAFDKINQQTLF